MNVRFCDIAARNKRHAPALLAAYTRVVERGACILGPEVETFEHAWAAYNRRRYAIGVGSGTDAIALLLEANGIGPGDEVIVPAHTCIATWLGVTRSGAVPVPADVDPRTYNLDPRRALERVGQRTAAILAVHIYGKPANIPALRAVSKAAGVPLFVDAAQAHGVRGEMLGDGAVFSFYPTKNLGALGDGGAVVTDDAEVAGKVRSLRNMGSLQKDRHNVASTHSRLDELQAAFLLAKLEWLDSENEIRRLHGRAYGQQGSVFHQCVILAHDRDRVRAELQEKGVETMVHYPTPPHLQPAYSCLGYRGGDFPNAELIADSILSLPVGPELTEDQVRYASNLVEVLA